MIQPTTGMARGPTAGTRTRRRARGGGARRQVEGQAREDDEPDAADQQVGAGLDDCVVLPDPVLLEDVGIRHDLVVAVQDEHRVDGVAVDVVTSDEVAGLDHLVGGQPDGLAPVECGRALAGLVAVEAEVALVEVLAVPQADRQHDVEDHDRGEDDLLDLRRHPEQPKHGAQSGRLSPVMQIVFDDGGALRELDVQVNNPTATVGDLRDVLAPHADAPGSAHRRHLAHADLGLASAASTRARWCRLAARRRQPASDEDGALGARRGGRRRRRPALPSPPRRGRRRPRSRGDVRAHERNGRARPTPH